MDGDIAGDTPGVKPIMGCDEPTAGNKVGSYEGNDILFVITPSFYLGIVLLSFISQPHPFYSTDISSMRIHYSI